MKKPYLVTKAEALVLGKRRPAYHTFESKPQYIQSLINQAIHLLDSFGIPVNDKSPRNLERMALAFLALCDVRRSDEWQNAKSLRDSYFLKTRDVIDFVNKHFGESISRGSYDDIRRKDLKHPILASIVVPAFPESAKNDPKRAWAINEEYIELIRSYNSTDWASRLETFLVGRQTLRDQLMGNRSIPKIPIALPSGVKLEFGVGEHNLLQKAIIEEFLPRYGYGARVIYIGDAEDKFLHYDQTTASGLGLSKLAHAELPDVVAFSRQKNWLFLIEAVHSSGPISPERIIVLQSFVKNCPAPIVYVTAFLDRATFRKFLPDIAWETEVWIASEPDHMIHFDGDKFLGPY
ncbi:BsuBI/PstI family type II restriction endonuclease [Candidatus Leptofilum sp.]|uniref:BsuBI/PstI family type II restriction endonuclease n=1 Tax=Candidatus Leptofilum sp. TaxID=3241576 RepID=UPI003B5CBD4A